MVTVAALMNWARSAGCERVIGRYVATPKNNGVHDLYPRMGFVPVTNDPADGMLVDDSSDGVTERLFQMDLRTYRAPKTYISVEER